MHALQGRDDVAAEVEEIGDACGAVGLLLSSSPPCQQDLLGAGALEGWDQLARALGVVAVSSAEDDELGPALAEGGQGVAGLGVLGAAALDPARGQEVANPGAAPGVGGQGT